MASERKIFYLSDKTKEQFTDILALFERNNMSSKQSDAFKIIVGLFHDLFIESSSTSSIPARLDQLKKEKEDSLQRVIKRQLDIATYLALANYHVAKDANWQPEQLASMHSQNNPEQSKLLQTILTLIQQDIAQGQTKKYSHKEQ